MLSNFSLAFLPPDVCSWSWNRRGMIVYDSTTWNLTELSPALGRSGGWAVWRSDLRQVVHESLLYYPSAVRGERIHASGRIYVQHIFWNFVNTLYMNRAISKPLSSSPRYVSGTARAVRPDQPQVMTLTANGDKDILTARAATADLHVVANSDVVCFSVYLISMHDALHVL